MCGQGSPNFSAFLPTKFGGKHCGSDTMHCFLLYFFILNGLIDGTGGSGFGGTTFPGGSFTDTDTYGFFPKEYVQVGCGLR